jgi:hypothetical protein
MWLPCRRVWHLTPKPVDHQARCHQNLQGTLQFFREPTGKGQINNVCIDDRSFRELPGPVQREASWTLEKPQPSFIRISANNASHENERQNATFGFLGEACRAPQPDYGGKV